jgi:cytochrome c553
VPNRLMLKIVFVTACFGAAASAFAADDVERGKTLSYTCLGCHGIEEYKNVYPTYSVPGLVGQHPEYLVAALKEYKSGERSHVTMHEQATPLSEEDMQDIASYFAGSVLKSGASVVGTPPQKVAQLCVACHGKDGVGISGAYPTLAGQHADYLLRALQEYQRGDRKNAVMATFVTSLSQADLELIAEYYSKQTPPLHTVARRSSFLSPN